MSAYNHWCCSLIWLFPRNNDTARAEATWVHQIFGGRLRSRVTCDRCHHHSDTFDSILDLSLEINGIYNLRDALRQFTKVDYLTGSNKYKCEKSVFHPYPFLRYNGLLTWSQMQAFGSRAKAVYSRQGTSSTHCPLKTLFSSWTKNRTSSQLRRAHFACRCYER